MGQGAPSKEPAKIRDMFSRIAKQYNFMNWLMTFGQDSRWRQLTIGKLNLRNNAQILDVGTGTGDLLLEALQKNEDITIWGADYTIEMLRVGKSKPQLKNGVFIGADALRLPYPDRIFDAVSSGFLLRNVTDVQSTMNEQFRVLKPGGRVSLLDTTKPETNLLTPLINFYLYKIIPFIGGIVSGDKQAYTYLPVSTSHFLSADKLEDVMKKAGFYKVDSQSLMFGTIAIHWGEKPLIEKI